MKSFILLMLAMCPLGTMCQFNMTAYRQMPPLFQLEDYDSCLENPKPSSYCVVIGEIVPNTTSALWNQIADFSADTQRHYRHDLLYFGVCLNHCKQLLDSLSLIEQDQLYTGKMQYTMITEFLDEITKRETDSRLLNDKVLNTCLNYKFKEQYGLQLRSYTHYCVSNDEPSNFDLSEIIFMLIVGTLLFCVILSSNYDRLLKRKQSLAMQGNEFYQQSLQSQKDTLMTSFSICRNYYRLTAQPRNELARDLKFFDAFRFAATVLVVFAHTLTMLRPQPTQNTEFVEKMFYKFSTQLFLNGTVVIQIFFVMSSFLLCVNFQRFLAPKNPGVADWGRLIFYRYLRIVPSLAFNILLNASILPRLQDGPFWKFTTGGESALCRETWWKNLLFINNFGWTKSCNPPTWYLAADFQLFVLFSALLIIIARYPKTRNYILGAGVVTAFLSTGMVTYFSELNGTHQDTPNTYRFYFLTEDTIIQSHVPSYMNIGGFIFGTIAAFMYLKYKNEDLNLKGKRGKLNRIILWSIPLPFLILLSGDIFFEFQFTKPSIWIGIYAALHRNIWALMCSALVLLMSFKVGSIMYRFCSMKIFVPLGRISFQVFLVHVFVTRCIIGSIRQPTHANMMLWMVYVIAANVISFTIGFFLYLFLESPLTTLINTTMKGRDKPLKNMTTNELIGLQNNKKEAAVA